MTNIKICITFVSNQQKRALKLQNPIVSGSISMGISGAATFNQLLKLSQEVTSSDVIWLIIVASCLVGSTGFTAYYSLNQRDMINSSNKKQR